MRTTTAVPFSSWITSVDSTFTSWLCRLTTTPFSAPIEPPPSRSSRALLSCVDSQPGEQEHERSERNRATADGRLPTRASQPNAPDT